MRVDSIVIPSGQTVDVIKNDEITAVAGVVLLHGSGTSERVSLRALALRSSIATPRTSSSHSSPVAERPRPLDNVGDVDVLGETSRIKLS